MTFVVTRVTFAVQHSAVAPVLILQQTLFYEGGHSFVNGMLVVTPLSKSFPLNMLLQFYALLQSKVLLQGFFWSFK